MVEWRKRVRLFRSQMVERLARKRVRLFGSLVGMASGILGSRCSQHHLLLHGMRGPVLASRRLGGDSQYLGARTLVEPPFTMMYTQASMVEIGFHTAPRVHGRPEQTFCIWCTMATYISGRDVAAEVIVKTYSGRLCRRKAPC
jgi:hypothetical protein